MTMLASFIASTASLPLPLPPPLAPLYCTLLAPLFGALLFSVCGQLRRAGIMNTVITAATFVAALLLVGSFLRHGYNYSGTYNGAYNGAYNGTNLALTTSGLLSLHQQFYIDAFNLLSIVLTTFIATTTAIFSSSYMWHSVETGKISPQQLRLYHVMYQLFVFMMLLALSTNNIGILWVAMEGATLATVLLVSLYRTKEAVEAAWKYFILCIIGIALALFGTVLVYAAASHSFADTNVAVLWSVLYQHASSLDAPIIKLAFVFLLVGYGTKIGLVPLHNWLPDAHSESPAPMSTLLSGLLLNVALYALVRFKILVDIALNNHLAGNLMMGFGLLSFVVAAILLHRQNNIKRLFSYSSIEHMGLMTFAFGLGGHLATFAALFYMLMHSLTKAAIFVTVGNVIQFVGTQSMEKIRSLVRNKALLGWTLLVASIAISGFPPFGIFTSELLLLIAVIKSAPWLALLIVAGLIVALAGLMRNIQPMVYGEKTAPTASLSTSKLDEIFPMFPALLHLALVATLGVYIPPLLTQLLQQATTIVTGIGGNI